MDYMSESTLKLPLRQLLYKIGWADRRTWVDILATIAAHRKEFPFISRTDTHTNRPRLVLPSSEDAHTLLFEIAKHDTDPDVRCACLKSLNQLAKHCKFGACTFGHSFGPKIRTLLTWPTSRHQRTNQRHHRPL
jgi:hypothetical protein